MPATAVCFQTASQKTAEVDSKRQKNSMVRVADVKTFESFETFMLAVPAGLDPGRDAAVMVWCATFSQFIMAAKFR